MLVASTPETTNPVVRPVRGQRHAVRLERLPVAALVLRPRGKPARPFKSTYHFFWGLEDIIGVFVDMWNTVPTNKVVGALWPNDGDGNAWGDPQRGFPPALAKAGYKLVDPGRYPEPDRRLLARRSPRSRRRRSRSSPACRIPPDWTTFWKQARPAGLPAEDRHGRQGAAVPALGRGAGRPRRRHVDRGVVDAAASVQVVAHRRERRGSSPPPTRRETKKQWTQPLGFIHALFEVALDVLKRTTSLDDKSADRRRHQGHQPQHDRRARSAGARGPCRTSTKTPLVGGQWGRGKDVPLRHGRSSSNQSAPSIPAPASSGRSALTLTALRSRCRRLLALDERLQGVRLAQVIDDLTLAVDERRGARRSSARTAPARRRAQPDRGRPPRRRGRVVFDGRDITALAAARALPRRHRPHAPDPASVRGD